MKTFDRKDIITIATAEDAKKYVGELGYPANNLSNLKTLVNNFAPYSLDKLEIDNDKPFFYREKSFNLFLPADKVKEIEEPKKYRPFKASWEFFSVVNKRVGEPIRIRAKTSNPLENVYLITGFTETHTRELKYIHLSAISYTPQEFLKNYEYFTNGTWQPFGVLDES